MRSTIYALSSGALPSGVAVIRLSGEKAFSTAQSMCGISPLERHAAYSTIRDPETNAVLDKGLILGFKGPQSFTGEDVVEFHCHGGVATVSALLDTFSRTDELRQAEPGEFSRRAFENGKMDLTQLEGLADLISAQTESQRCQSLNQSGGVLRDLYVGWRDNLIRCRALIEAELDFSDEEDVPGSVSDAVWSDVSKLIQSLDQHLDDQNRGEIVRDGFKVALLGPPNSGKSSLLNALAKRDVAIVTPEAGTTRDVLSVNLDIDGVLVIFSDTAGLRETDNIVEKEGIKRALSEANSADLVIWLSPIDSPSIDSPVRDSLVVHTKGDLGSSPALNDQLTISTNFDVAPDGIEPLMHRLSIILTDRIGDSEQPVATRKRHRATLIETRSLLVGSLTSNADIELRSEFLRQASDSLGKLTGRIDVEDLLDVIFNEFCIGK